MEWMDTIISVWYWRHTPLETIFLVCLVIAACITACLIASYCIEAKENRAFNKAVKAKLTAFQQKYNSRKRRG